MTFALSGTVRFALSGTGSSPYREPASPRNPLPGSRCAHPNHANRESFGFLLTSERLWKSGFEPGRIDVRRGCPDAGLTHVWLVWHEGRHEDWLRFGNPVASRIIDRRRRVESYAPGQCFAVVRWASNDHGTIRSTIDIVRAVAPGEPYTTLPGIEPGGDILLSARGWPRVRKVLEAIDRLEDADFAACEVAPDHWRHVHNRLAAGLSPRPYSLRRHRAWLRRRSMQP